MKWILQRLKNSFESTVEKVIFSIILLIIYSLLLLTPFRTILDNAILGYPTMPTTLPDKAPSVSSPERSSYLGFKKAFAQPFVSPNPVDIQQEIISKAKERFTNNVNNVIENDYKYAGRRGLLRKPHWCWKIYVKDHDSLNAIRSVHYDYGGWFDNETINATGRATNFSSTAKTGWGVFNVMVTITYVDDKSITRPYKLSFNTETGGILNDELCD